MMVLREHLPSNINVAADRLELLHTPLGIGFAGGA
jgi:hypothetical protein